MADVPKVATNDSINGAEALFRFPENLDWIAGTWCVSRGTFECIEGTCRVLGPISSALKALSSVYLITSTPQRCRRQPRCVAQPRHDDACPFHPAVPSPECSVKVCDLGWCIGEGPKLATDTRTVQGVGVDPELALVPAEFRRSSCSWKKLPTHRV